MQSSSAGAVRPTVLLQALLLPVYESIFHLGSRAFLYSAFHSVVESSSSKTHGLVHQVEAT